MTSEKISAPNENIDLNELKGKKHGQWIDVMRRLTRNKLAMAGAVIILIMVLIAVFADVLAPYDYSKMDMANRFAPLSSAHWFGTDEYGRDILSRMIYGARTSLLVALGGVIICVVIGCILGLVTGFFGGWTDTIYHASVGYLYGYSGSFTGCGDPGVIGCWII